jgi:hypothetical protein
MARNLDKALHAAAAILTIGLLSMQSPAYAQTTAAPATASVLPTGGGKALFDTSDTAILLLDHQAGLFQTVKDISITELRTNTVMLAKLATLLKIPVITTASEPGGPNGPLMPEIHEHAPHALYAVMDASGDPSEMSSRTTLGRFVQAGVVPTSTNAVLSEAHRTWDRPEAAELAKLYALVAPNYAAVIESYSKAKEVARQSVGQ